MSTFKGEESPENDCKDVGKHQDCDQGTEEELGQSVEYGEAS